MNKIESKSTPLTAIQETTSWLPESIQQLLISPPRKSRGIQYGNRSSAPAAFYFSGSLDLEKNGILNGVANYRMILGDGDAAILLHQIVYWYNPTRKGHPKLRVQAHSRYWLAKTAEELERETGIPERQIYRKLDLLRERGLIDTFNGTFAKKKAIHIALIAANGAAMLEHGRDLVFLNDKHEEMTEEHVKELQKKGFWYIEPHPVPSESGTTNAKTI